MDVCGEHSDGVWSDLAEVSVNLHILRRGAFTTDCTISIVEITGSCNLPAHLRGGPLE